jgi:hypothetical protein
MESSVATSGLLLSAAHVASASAWLAVACAARASALSASASLAAAPSPEGAGAARSMEVTNRANPVALYKRVSVASSSESGTRRVTRSMPTNFFSRLSLDSSRTHSSRVASALASSPASASPIATGGGAPRDLTFRPKKSAFSETSSSAPYLHTRASSERWPEPRPARAAVVAPGLERWVPRRAGLASDLALDALVLAVAAAHVFLAPYAKVEESFNLQATHDVMYHGWDLASYDHHAFPGVVPRTFIGAIALAALAKPLHVALVFLRVLDSDESRGTKMGAQIAARLALATVTVAALGRMRRVLRSAFGEAVGVAFACVVASQFHLTFYASRTLPNTFALALTTLAAADWFRSARRADVVVFVFPRRKRLRRRPRLSRRVPAHGLLRDFPVRHRAAARAGGRAHAAHARVFPPPSCQLGRAMRRGVPGNHRRRRHGDVGAALALRRRRFRKLRAVAGIGRHHVARGSRFLVQHLREQKQRVGRRTVSLVLHKRAASLFRDVDALRPVRRVERT